MKHQLHISPGNGGEDAEDFTQTLGTCIAKTLGSKAIEDNKSVVVEVAQERL